jgi:Spy/CpxP family protein refolding chaperone
MRSRERVLQSLENVYRSAFTAAEEAGDAAAMERLDLEYQRDQLQLEVLLDIRDVLTPDQPDKTTSLLEKAQQLRRLTKLRP